MYLAAVIPGPNEPHLTELNHHIRPVVDQFLVSWERRIHFTQTANHPTGRDTCSAIATAVCDLPAARKFSQSAGHSSHFLCTRCDCYHKSTVGRTDCEKWSVQDCTILRQRAAQWKVATDKNHKINSFLNMASVGLNYGAFRTGTQLACLLSTPCIAFLRALHNFTSEMFSSSQLLMLRLSLHLLWHLNMYSRRQRQQGRLILWTWQRMRPSKYPRSKPCSFLLLITHSMHLIF